jgi:hypothetical protein
VDNLGLERKVEDVVTVLTADAARRAEILCENILYDSGLEAPDLTAPPWQRSSPLARALVAFGRRRRGHDAPRDRWRVSGPSPPLDRAVIEDAFRGLGERPPSVAR